MMMSSSTTRCHPQEATALVRRRRQCQPQQWRRQRRRRRLVLLPTTTMNMSLLSYPTTLIMCSSSMFMIVLLVLWNSNPVSAVIEPIIDSSNSNNGTSTSYHCNIFSFVPFTLNGTDIPHYHGKRINNLGFSHHVAASMAIKHFIERNSEVVPELANEEFHPTRCTIQIDPKSSLVFDSGINNGHKSTVALQETILNGNRPCALAGPFHDIPGQYLSVMASSIESPIVIHGSNMVHLSHDFVMPFMNQINSPSYAIEYKAIEFLRDIGRTNYVSVLYSLDDYSVETKQFLTRAMTARGMTWDSFGYWPTIAANEKTSGIRIQTPTYVTESASLDVVLQEVKDRGYRTIIVVAPWFELERAMPIIASEAERLKMNNNKRHRENEWFWSFFGSAPQLAYVQDPVMRQNANITNLLKGAALFMTIENYMLDPINDKFLQSWKSQTEEFLQFVKSHSPIQDPNQAGYYDAPDDYFTSVKPEPGAGFMYDAVMSILMGACHAQAASSSSFSLENLNGTPPAISGMTHVRGIRSVNFTGASGLVTLPDGVRHNNITMGVFNLLPPPSRDSSGTDGDAATAPVGYVLADSYKSGTNRGDLPVRTHVQDFTFADGGKVAPKFLRDEPNQNHLGYRFRATGFVLFGVTTLCLLLCALWVIVHRDHEVVRLASPKLLVGLCFGALVEASCILLVSIDEGLKFPTIVLLNRICHSVPWLLMIGHSINTGILFVMLRRIARNLQVFSELFINRISWVVWFIIGIEMLLFLVSTVIKAAVLHWNRQVVDLETGESFARCRITSRTGVVAFLVIFSLFLALVNLAFAFKSKAENDAWWIYTFIVIQIETIIVCIPLVVILDNVSTDGRHIGFCFILLFAGPVEVIAFIFLPKILTFYKIIDQNPIRVRGARPQGGVHISGVAHPSSQVTSTARGSTKAEQGSKPFST